MSRSRGRRVKLPREPVTVTITSLSHEGRGVGHIAGKVAFVDGALPGETVSAAYLSQRGKFDELRTLQVLSAAALRVEPACQYAEICGGCTLQHLAAERQLDFKQGVLLEHLQHAAGLTPAQFNLLPQLGAGHYHYRRKARLAVRLVLKKGGVLVGFREKQGTFITDMDDCQVLVREAAALIRPLRDMLAGLSLRGEIPQIEVAAGERDRHGDELEVALVLRHLRPLPGPDLAILKEFAAEHRVQFYLQPKGVDSVHKLFPEDGQERLHYFLPEFDLRMAFHPLDFTQINGDLNRQIVSRSIELLELDPADRVLDLFCGLGNFTLAMARRCARVTGIEGNVAMVNRAQENAALNNIDNAEFACADLSAPLSGSSWFGPHYDKILLDPPRSGALEIMAQLANIKARKILYVSCNPVTLARDAAILKESGYRLKSAGVMDMFPHTAHVESMAEFELGV